MDVADGDYEAFRFLLHGLIASPSPVVVLALERGDAAAVAVELYQSAAELSDLLPEPEGRLFELSADALRDLDADASESLCAELVSGGHWIYVADLSELLPDQGPTEFIRVVVDHVARGDLPCALFAVRPEEAEPVLAHSLCLAGFAHVLSRDEAGRLELMAPSRAVAREAVDRSDTGWLIAVRFDLREPLGDPEGDFKANERARISGALVDHVQLVQREGEEPAGALLGLEPSAFTIGQEEASFEAAAAAAENFIGRPLLPSEHLVATRGLYYG